MKHDARKWTRVPKLSSSVKFKSAAMRKFRVKSSDHRSPLRTDYVQRRSDVRREARGNVGAGRSFVSTVNEFRPEERNDYCGEFFQYRLGLKNANNKEEYLANGLHRSHLDHFTQREFTWSMRGWDTVKSRFSKQVLEASWARNGRENRVLDPLTGCYPDGSRPRRYVTMSGEGERAYGCSGENCELWFAQFGDLMQHWCSTHTYYMLYVSCKLCGEEVPGVEIKDHFRQQHQADRRAAAAMADEVQHPSSRRRNAERLHKGEGPHDESWVGTQVWNKPWFSRSKMEKMARENKKGSPWGQESRAASVDTLDGADHLPSLTERALSTDKDPVPTEPMSTTPEEEPVPQSTAAEAEREREVLARPQREESGEEPGDTRVVQSTAPSTGKLFRAALGQTCKLAARMVKESEEAEATLRAELKRACARAEAAEGKLEEEATVCAELERARARADAAEAKLEEEATLRAELERARARADAAEAKLEEEATLRAEIERARARADVAEDKVKTAEARIRELEKKVTELDMDVTGFFGNDIDMAEALLTICQK